MNAAQKRLLKQNGIDLVAWEQGKHRARELVSETVEFERRKTALNWAWGDLSLEIVPNAWRGGYKGLSGRKRNELVSSLLDLWVDDYAFPMSHSSLRGFRSVSSSWPRDKRSKASWSAHMELSSNPDRFTLITDALTVDEAIALSGRRTIKERKQEAFAGNEARNHTLGSAASSTRAFAHKVDEYVTTGDTPDEDDLEKLDEAWLKLSKVVDGLGRFDRLLAKFDDMQQFVGDNVYLMEVPKAA